MAGRYNNLDSAFHSTFDVEVLGNFRLTCKEQNVNMNKVLSAFMNRFIRDKNFYTPKYKDENRKYRELKGWHTTMDKESIENFKKACAERGFSFNEAIESFMIEYSNGDFILDIIRNNENK